MGTQLPFPKRGRSPRHEFSAHVHCGQTAGWIKTALGMEVGLGPRHVVLDGDPAPIPKGAELPPIFGPFYCGKTAGCIKVLLGMEVGLRPCDFVLDEDPAHLHKRGGTPPIFRPTSIVAKRLHGSRCHCYGGRPRPTRYCVRWRPSSPPLQGHRPPFSVNVRCGQTAGWTKMPLGMEVGLGPGNCVRTGPSYPQKKGTPTSTQFWPVSIVAKLLDG